MRPDSLLMALTLLLYFLASVSTHAHLLAGSDRARRAALVLLPTALLAHTAAIGAWCTTHPGSLLRDPGMPYSVAAYFVAAAQTAANLRPRWTSLGSLSTPIAFLAQFYAAVRTPGSAVHDPHLTGILRPHVLVLLLGFAAFTFAFCLAVLYLLQARLLKAKRLRGHLERFPPLESVGSNAHRLAAIGFSMLTLGIVSGAMVAPERWGPLWYLDPRTVTSVAAWLIYAAYLGGCLIMGWRGRKTTYFLIAGYALVLVAFLVSTVRPRTAQAADRRGAAGSEARPRC